MASTPDSSGRLYRTQSTHVPAGASGSSTRSAKLTVPAGAPLQTSGGETSAPSHVYLAGTAEPSVKAGLVSAKAMLLQDSGGRRRAEKPNPGREWPPG